MSTSHSLIYCHIRCSRPYTCSLLSSEPVSSVARYLHSCLSTRIGFMALWTRLSSWSFTNLFLYRSLIFWLCSFICAPLIEIFCIKCTSFNYCYYHFSNNKHWKIECEFSFSFCTMYKPHKLTLTIRIWTHKKKQKTLRMNINEESFDLVLLFLCFCCRVYAVLHISLNVIVAISFGLLYALMRLVWHCNSKNKNISEWNRRRRRRRREKKTKKRNTIFYWRITLRSSL